MDIFFDKRFLNSIPERALHRIDHKLDLISKYTVNQFWKSVSCRKIKSCNGIFNFRFNIGECIIFKYISNGIQLIKYATHDKQIKLAERCNKVCSELSDNLIKWNKNSIAIILGYNVSDEENKHEQTDCYVKENENENISTMDEDLDMDKEYIEDCLDDEIDRDINDLIKKGLLSDSLEEVRDLYLEKDNIEKAIFYDEIINVSEKRAFFCNNKQWACCIEINKNASNKINKDNIRQAFNIVYTERNLYVYPLFCVSVEGTGIYKILYLHTENKKLPQNNQEQVVSKIINEIGEISLYGNILIECLLYSNKDNSMQKNIWLDIYTDISKCLIKKYTDMRSRALEKRKFAVNIETTADEKCNKITANRGMVLSQENLVKNNLAFIFGNDK